MLKEKPRFFNENNHRNDEDQEIFSRQQYVLQDPEKIYELMNSLDPSDPEDHALSYLLFISQNQEFDIPNFDLLANILIFLDPNQGLNPIQINKALELILQLLAFKKKETILLFFKRPDSILTIWHYFPLTKASKIIAAISEFYPDIFSILQDHDCFTRVQECLKSNPSDCDSALIFLSSLSASPEFASYVPFLISFCISVDDDNLLSDALQCLSRGILKNQSILPILFNNSEFPHIFEMNLTDEFLVGDIFNILKSIIQITHSFSFLSQLETALNAILFILNSELYNIALDLLSLRFPSNPEKQQLGQPFEELDLSGFIDYPAFFQALFSILCNDNFDNLNNKFKAFNILLNAISQGNDSLLESLLENGLLDICEELVESSPDELHPKIANLFVLIKSYALKIQSEELINQLNSLSSFQYIISYLENIDNENAQAFYKVLNDNVL